MKSDIYSKIPSMNLRELWQLYVSTFFEILDTDDELRDEYNTVRSGTNSPFDANIDIYDIIIEEESEMEPSSAKFAAIYINPMKQEMTYQGNTYPLYNYRTEKERRKALLQKRLLIEYSDDSKFESQLES